MRYCSERTRAVDVLFKARLRFDIHGLSDAGHGAPRHAVDRGGGGAGRHVDGRHPLVVPASW